MIQEKAQLYVNRMQGQRFDPSRHASKGPAPPTRLTILVSTFITSFIGIAITSSLTYNAQWFMDRNTPVLTGAFGATAVLIYGAIDAPLSQPRNVFCGHVMSAIVGVSLYKLFNLMQAATFARLHWLLCSLSVSVSLFLMQLTHTVHPPASATSLIAVTGGDLIYNLGYWYVLCPVALGVALMLVVAIVGNNVARRYPMHWWSAKNRTITIVNQDMSAVIADLISDADDEEDDQVCCRPDNDVVDQVQTDDDDNLSTRVASQVETKDASGSPGIPLEPKSPVSSHAQTTILNHPREVSTAADSNLAQSPRWQRRHSHHRHHHHHYGGEQQYAIFFDGESHRDLENGERVHQRRPSLRAASPHSRHSQEAAAAAAIEAANALHIDLERGNANATSDHCLRRRHSIDPSNMRIRKRGSTLTLDSDAYQRTIQELQARVRELEQELTPARSQPTDESSATPPQP